jgi:hypothetical protein
MNNLPTVSVAIPSRNRKEELRQPLAVLRAKPWPRGFGDGRRLYLVAALPR